MDPSFDPMAAPPVTRDDFFAAAEAGDLKTIHRFFTQPETLAVALRLEATITDDDLIEYAGKELHRDEQPVVSLTSWIYRKNRNDHIFRAAIMNHECEVVQWLYTWPLAPFLRRTLQFFLFDAAVCAVVFKEDDFIDELLQSHAWATYPDQAKPIVLSALIRAGIDLKSSTVLRIVSAHGADFNRRFDHGFGTLLYHTACYDPQTMMTRELVQHGMFTVGQDVALHRAARDGNHDVIRRLLAFDIDPHSRDRALNTPLHYAAKQGYFESVATILECACVDVDAKDEDGDTPLILAISESWCRDEDESESEGSDEDVRRWRASTCYRRMFNILLDYGADPNILLPSGEDVYTPLHHAVSGLSVEAVRQLLARGVDPNTRSLKRQRTPAHMLVRDGSYQRQSLTTLKLLVQHGANLTCEDEDGVTPLSQLQQQNWWNELPEDERSRLLSGSQ